MEKQEFYSALEDYLEIENVNESSSLELSSMGILSVIALVDENFDKQLIAADLKMVKVVSDLMNLIGKDNFTE